MNRPKISVIVPVYNVERFLKRCLDSICNQTYRNLEIICIDDGSTDASSDILREYKEQDSRIILITQPNQGLSAARNAGLKVATGEWITGVDSDDYISLDAYQKISERFQPDIDIIWFGIEPVGEGGMKNSSWLNSYVWGKKTPTWELVSATNCFFWNKLWRKSFLDAHPTEFPVGLQYEDAYFYFTLAPHARNIYFILEKLYFYYQRADSIMNKRTAKGADHISIAELILEKFNSSSAPEGFTSSPPSRFSLFIWEGYTKQGLRHTPREMHKSIFAEAKRIADKFHLSEIYPKEVQKVCSLAHPKLVYWNYKRTQLLSFLTWGNKHRKYSEKKEYYRELLRICRYLFKTS